MTLIEQLNEQAGVRSDGEAKLMVDAAAEMSRLQVENMQLRSLLNDKNYIRIKADLNRGHLSWANTVEELERGLNL